MELTIEQVKRLSPRFKNATNESVQSWMDIAKPIVDLRLPEDVKEYGWSLLSAHVGMQVINANGVNSETMGSLSHSFFDWSDKTTDPFLDLYNQLLSHYGLDLIGKNRVKFY